MTSLENFRAMMNRAGLDGHGNTAATLAAAVSSSSSSGVHAASATPTASATNNNSTPANSIAANAPAATPAVSSASAPQWLPLDITVTPPVADLTAARLGSRDPELAFDLDFRYCGPRLADDTARWRDAFAARHIALPPGAEIHPIGEVLIAPAQTPPGGAYHLREKFYPLAGVTSLDELRAFPWPDLDATLDAGALAEEVAAIHAAGKVAVCHMEMTVFEAAWYRRGMDVLFADLIEGNEIGAWLLDWFTDYSARRAKLVALAGVDVVGLGDDIGTQRGMMMSLPFWREHLKPRLKRVIDTLRAHQRAPLWVRYHSDGDIRPAIDDLVEIGVDILNPMQPECMPVTETIDAHRHHLAFWGMIGTQTTMPFGTPADVRAALAECARLARAGAGVIVAPTHVLEPDVPWENIAALTAAIRDERL
ncbi:MAG: uroporphyrinogen decarboxylase family protein [Opitutaceae bacterium]|jgi:uroporphyrinogen decarboxylase|nr:uroporphyrinogen decarboxylase family protein [Opitutaceae bacterium]